MCVDRVENAGPDVGVDQLRRAGRHADDIAHPLVTQLHQSEHGAVQGQGLREGDPVRVVLVPKRQMVNAQPFQGLLERARLRIALKRPVDGSASTLVMIATPAATPQPATARPTACSLRPSA